MENWDLERLSDFPQIVQIIRGYISIMYKMNSKYINNTFKN